MSERPLKFIDRKPVGIIGSSREGPGTCAYDASYQIAKGLAEIGLVILCGGRSGVMAAACHGARDGGGISIALLPSRDDETANPYATIILTTDLGNEQNPIAQDPIEISRNRVIASAASCLVAIAGGTGTANEIKFALQFGKDVFGLCRSRPPEHQLLEQSPGRYWPVADARTAIAEVRRSLGFDG